MSTVHETLSDTRVFHERLVVHTIVHKQKSTRFSTSTDDPTLALQNTFDSVSVIIAVNEQVRNKLTVIMVSVLSSRHDDPGRYVTFVIHNVRDQRRFTGSSFSYEDTHFVVRNFSGIKLTKL